MCRLHIAYMLEQGSAVAGTALVVTMLIDRGVDPRVSGLVLAATGVGKVGGRLTLTGRIGQTPPHLLAGGRSRSAGEGRRDQHPRLAPSTAWLFAAALASGIAAGTSSVLRPLMIAHHVPLYRFAWASARLQTSTTLARAAGPVIVAGAAPYAGWTAAWRRLSPAASQLPQAHSRLSENRAGKRSTNIPNRWVGKNERGGGCLCLEVRQNAV